MATFTTEMHIFAWKDRHFDIQLLKILWRNLILSCDGTVN